MNWYKIPEQIFILTHKSSTCWTSFMNPPLLWGGPEIFWPFIYSSPHLLPLFQSSQQYKNLSLPSQCSSFLSIPLPSLETRSKVFVPWICPSKPFQSSQQLDQKYPSAPPPPPLSPLTSPLFSLLSATPDLFFPLKSYVVSPQWVPASCL